MSMGKKTTKPVEESKPGAAGMEVLTDEERARRRRFYEKLTALKGKIHLNVNIDESRGRNRR